MALRLEMDKPFYEFASDIMRSFNTGIQGIHIETIPIEDYFGEDNKQDAENFS